LPLTSWGTDARKRIAGRKRGILTETMGLILLCGSNTTNARRVTIDS